jgi:hypothetical protein
VRLLFFAIFIVSTLSLILFGYIVWTVPPTLDGNLVITNFLYALVLGTIGLFGWLTLLIYFVSSFTQTKKSITDQQPSRTKAFWMAVRRALLISILVSGLVILRTFELLNILNLCLLVGILVLVEIYFSNR